MHCYRLCISSILPTVYPKKYAHGFVVLCFVVVMQSFIMNSNEVFIHIHQGCFAGTGAIVRLPQCQWSKPDGYGKISQCITTTKHSKAKTVCIFLGIYCTYWTWYKFNVCYIGTYQTAKRWLSSITEIRAAYISLTIHAPFQLHWLSQYRHNSSFSTICYWIYISSYSIDDDVPPRWVTITFVAFHPTNTSH